MKLPFELYKNHKSNTKKNWKTKGLICSEEELEEIYQRYIYSSHCEICEKIYETRDDRQMDHSHETGEFRNICCRSCNLRKRDVKISDNKSGYKYIYEQNDPACKQGFIWQFQVTIDGKRKKIKSSVDLEKLVKFRDEWFKQHPDYHT